MGGRTHRSEAKPVHIHDREQPYLESTRSLGCRTLQGTRAGRTARSRKSTRATIGVFPRLAAFVTGTKHPERSMAPCAGKPRKFVFLGTGRASLATKSHHSF